SWRRRSHLSAGRFKDCEPAVSTRGTRPAVRTLRCRNAHGARHRRCPRTLDADPLWVASKLFHHRLRRTLVAGAVVSDDTARAPWTRRSRRGNQQARFRPGPRRVGHEPESARDLPDVLLLRLLLVLPRELAA